MNGYFEVLAEPRFGNRTGAVPGHATRVHTAPNMLG
jgi:hypothetical protein